MSTSLRLNITQGGPNIVMVVRKCEHAEIRTVPSSQRFGMGRAMNNVGQPSSLLLVLVFLKHYGFE